MMALSQYDSQKIDHDLKRIAKGMRLVKEEDNKEKRNFILELVMDEYDRLHQDIIEMTEKTENNVNNKII